MVEPAMEDPISASPTDATTAAALAALRRMSFAVVDAADQDAIHRTSRPSSSACSAWTPFTCARWPRAAPGPPALLPPGTDGSVEGDEQYIISFDRPTRRGARVFETGEPLNVTDAPSSPVVASELARALQRGERPLRAARLLGRGARRDRAGQRDAALVPRGGDRVRLHDGEPGLGRPQRARDARAASPTRPTARPRSRAPRAPSTRGSTGARCSTPSAARRPWRWGPTSAASTSATPSEGGVAVAANGIADDSDWWGYRIAPGRGRGGPGAEHGRAGGDERLPGRVTVRARRDRPDRQVQDRRVRADGLERPAPRGALSVAFFSVRPVERRGHRDARGDRQPGRGGLQQRRGLRGGHRGGPHRLAHRAAQPRRDPDAHERGDLARPARRAAARLPARPTSTTSSPSTTATATWSATRS